MQLHGVQLICSREREYYTTNTHLAGMAKNVARAMLGLEPGGGSEALCWCTVGYFNDDVLLSSWVDAWHMGTAGLL